MATSPRSALVVLMLLGLLSVGACSGLRVQTDFDPDVDFSRYRTFAWQDPPLKEAPRDSVLEELVDPFARNSLLDKRVRKLVERELIVRGYRVAVGEAAQFRVNYHVVLTDRTRITGHGPGGGYGCVGRRGCYGGGWGGVTSYNYQEGTFILDVIDPDSNRIAWRGWAVGTNPKRYYTEERIEAAVKKVLERFPPDGSKPAAPARDASPAPRG